MDELDGDVLRVRGEWSLTKCKQAAATKKAIGHFTARFRQSRSFSREERLEDLIARQKALFNFRGKLALGSHFG
jgi:hypothetical protein